MGNYKFGLNIPPFTLKITVSNFENKDSIIIEETIDYFERLPKDINQVLSKSSSFKKYISAFSNDFYLHFIVELYNSVEKVHNEFFSKKVAELIY